MTLRRWCGVLLSAAAFWLGTAGALAAPQPAPQPVIVLPAPPAAPTGVAAVEVIGIEDAGEILVRASEGGAEERVRLVGVLVPRNSDPKRAALDRASHACVEDLLVGERVVLETQTGSDGEARTDREGNRFVMAYRTPDGLCVNLEIVRRGWVRADTRTGFKHLETVRAYEAAARSAKRGVWGRGAVVFPDAESAPAESEAPAPQGPAPKPITATPPPEAAPTPAPAKPAAAADGTVWVTRSGTKYHQKNCRHRSEDAAEVSISDAKARGLKPCKVCKPPE